MKCFKTIALVSLLMVSPLTQASVVKVFDALLDKAQLETLLTSRGIFDRGVIGQVGKNVRYSLQDISSSSKIASMKELKNMGKLITNPEDKAKYAELMKVMSKDSKEITREELVTTINSLVLLSQRYGVRSKSILACAPCVNKELAETGFNFTLNELKDPASQRIFKEMNKKAKDPMTASKFINSEVSKAKLGSAPSLSATDEEAFIYFLMIPKHGTEEQKRVYDAIVKVSKTKSGSTDMFDADNGHKLYNIFSDSLTPSELNLWEDLLEDTAKTMKEEDMGTMDAFYRTLEKRAESVSDQAEKNDLLAKLDYIKREGCFSRK
ncbi:hypothetical protein [Bacteriovorax sp. Seq25_V]|uniref:hypothetical protein n=1 Tax=Bacteriovorax sp. Seq25_V TaxID=1201288 RepID=UPI00038A0BC3|nr:hypothetical protein [Bacteriovorax sp. Seq25_V]EQC45599.1 hypothetical protein M900_2252 [Bacteriovorax sp. Seq25_V]